MRHLSGEIDETATDQIQQVALPALVRVPEDGTQRA